VKGTALKAEHAFFLKKHDCDYHIKISMRLRLYKLG
jgi:hypothetical protein